MSYQCSVCHQRHRGEYIRRLGRGVIVCIDCKELLLCPECGADAQINIDGKTIECIECYHPIYVIATAADEALWKAQRDRYYYGECADKWGIINSH